MAYQYRCTIGGSSGAYISFDVQGSFAPGESVSVEGEVYNGSYYMVNNISFQSWPESITDLPLYGSSTGENVRYVYSDSIGVSVANGKTVPFKLAFTVPDLSGYVGSSRINAFRFGFLVSYTTVRGDMNTIAIYQVSGSRLYYLRYRLDPQILAFDFERCDDAGVWANDGLYFRCKSLKLSINSRTSVSDITTARITCRDQNGSVQRTVNLSSAQLSSAVGYYGYSEGGYSSSNLFYGFESQPGLSYTLTLEFGDSYNSATGADSVMRSFARLHLSGAANGGVAVGMFSSATDAQPKFEVADNHRSIFYSEASVNDSGELSGGTEITGVNSFQKGEHLTGGYWVDGKPIYRYVFDEDVNLSSGVNTVRTFNFLVEKVVNMMGSIQERTRTGEKFSPLTAAVSSSNPYQQAICVRLRDYNALEIEAGANVVSNNGGSFHATIILEYTKPDGPARVKRPIAAMTANSSQNCVASASTVYSSSYPAWKAFSNNLENSWASKANDSAPYLQLQMDVALKNIAVEVYARKTSTIRNPTAGNIQGSTNGSSWTTIGSFSGWSPTLSNGLLGEVSCSHTTAYKYVRINFTSRSNPSDYVAVGNVKISGEL